MSIIIFVIILMVLILGHEFGHFFAARKFKVKVEEFGIGYPPRAMKLFTWKRTLFSLNWLPFGGFCKIYGENPDEENTSGAEASVSMVNKPKYKQAIILFSGVLANFLLAWLLFSFGFMSGLPASINNQPKVKGFELQDISLVVVSALEGSPAEIGGLKSGDKIISMESGEDLLPESEINPDTLKSFILSHPENEIEFSYLRGQDPKINIAKITPENNDGNPAIGIAMDQIGIAKLPVFRAFWEGMKLNIFVTKSTAVGLSTLVWEGIRGQGSFDSVTGPVGIVGIVGDASKFGLAYLLSFAALISINLAIINLIPFPALDGGRLLFLLIEKIKGSRINSKVANSMNMVGFVILILLMLLVTYHDIVKLF